VCEWGSGSLKNVFIKVEKGQEELFLFSFFCKLIRFYNIVIIKDKKKYFYNINELMEDIYFVLINDVEKIIFWVVN